MASRQQRLEELGDWFARSIRTVFETAYAIEEPAGVSDAWRAVCEQHGVTPIDDEERQQVRAAQRPLRGAPVMEMVPIVSEICRQGRVALNRIDVWEEGQEAKTLHERLGNLFGRTDRELVGAYKKAVLPKPGGMFANVLASHDPSKKTKGGASAHSLRCKTCGAPRLNDEDFTCAFCDNPMV